VCCGSAALVPEFKWAENHENIFLTIDLSDAKDVKVDMQEDGLTFRASAQGKEFALDLKLKKKIDAAKSTFSVKGRDVKCLLVKAEADQGWWNGLLADKNAYKGRVKIDWDLWRDEDDVDEKDTSDFAGGMPGMGGMGGMGMPGMPGMGGMGGMGMGGMGMGGMGGMDMAEMMKQMGGMGGMGGMGMGGDDEEGEGDSDDEDLPDLEQTDDAKPAEEAAKPE